MGRAGARWGLLADKVVFVMAPTEGTPGFSPRPWEGSAQHSGAPIAVGNQPPHVSSLQALERHGGIDILVSNAAVKLFFGSMLDASEDVWNKILQVNGTSLALLVSLVLPPPRRNRGGSIILVSSIAGFSPFLALGPYSVSKTALLGLRKALAPELGTRNIRTNCLAPGIVQTKFSSALWKDEAIKEKMLKNLRVPQLGVPSDCVGIVSFLCFPDTS
ncbi:dehydrogenase/reductase SDR family member 4-like [Eretmochelys imbricata]